MKVIYSRVTACCIMTYSNNLVAVFIFLIISKYILYRGIPPRLPPHPTAAVQMEFNELSSGRVLKIRSKVIFAEKVFHGHSELYSDIYYTMAAVCIVPIYSICVVNQGCRSSSMTFTRSEFLISEAR